MSKYKSNAYKNALGEQLLKALYQKQLVTIKVPFEEKTVKTRFWETHVIRYGNPNGIPVFGFHGGNSTNPYSLRTFTKHINLIELDLLYQIQLVISA